MSDAEKDVTLAVLAGGEGSRMGRPKGELLIRGRPILSYLLEQFGWPGPTLLVTAPGREHPPGWRDFSREAADPVSGRGPLRGVLTALEHADTDLVVIATVDMPGVTGEPLRWLSQRLRQRPGLLGIMLFHGERVEPFPSAFRAAAAPVVGETLQRGRGAVHELERDSRVALLPAPSDWPHTVWANLNVPADLDDFPFRPGPVP
jgi:molybdopterin-guanine dinucleotide biosynthesis protein A